MALLFGILIWIWAVPTTAREYYADYIIEKTLSVDNVFVFALIFTYFAVPIQYQYRVLFWGVVGALVLALSSFSSGRSFSKPMIGWFICSGYF